MANAPALSIGDIAVRQLDGLYSLNDLHKASGGADKHQPAKFIRLDQAQDLIAALDNSPEVASLETAAAPSVKTKEGRNGGTYACRELVIAYAAWINAEFHLKVIRVFLNAVLPTAPYTVQPSDTLNEAQQIALRTLLETNVKRLPHGKQAGAMVQGWSKLKAHFGVPYRQIPAHEFTEALSIVARHVSAWELTDKSPKPTTALQPVATQPTLRNRRWLLTTEADGSEVVQAIGPDDFVATWPSLVKSVAAGECLRANAELLDMASACMHRLQQRNRPAIAI